MEKTFYFTSGWAACEKAEKETLPTTLDYRTETCEGGNQKIQGNPHCDTRLDRLANKVKNFVNRNANIDFEVNIWDENESLWMDRK